MLLLENTGMFLVGTDARAHVDVQGPCRTGAALHWLQGSGELAPLTYRALGKAGPASGPGQHNRTDSHG